MPFSGGGESLAAILGGRVTAGISGYGEYEGQIKAGKLRAIGVTSPQAPARRRRADLQGAGHRSRAHQLALGGGARPASRAAQKKALDRARRARLVKSTAWKDILKQKGWDDAYLPADAFATFLKEEQRARRRRAQVASGW